MYWQKDYEVIGGHEDQSIQIIAADQLAQKTILLPSQGKKIKIKM